MPERSSEEPKLRVLPVILGYITEVVVAATPLSCRESTKNRVSVSERLLQAGLALPVRLKKDVIAKVPDTQLTSSSAVNAQSLTTRSDELLTDDTPNVKTSEEEDIFMKNQQRIREISCEETNSNDVNNRISWETITPHLPSSFICFPTYVDYEAVIYFHIDSGEL